MIRKLATIALFAMVAAMLISSGCGGHGSKNKNKEEAKPVYVSKGDEGTISGTVSFDGVPPAAKSIDMSGDAQCMSAASDKKSDEVLVTSGKLANVLVYLKGGPADKFSFPVSSDAVVLDQKGCRYHPRTLGIQVNQKFEVTNSDPTTHNVHPSPRLNKEWNQSQTAGQAPIVNSFTKKELMVPVKCNQHNWMRANVGVLDHPFFAVSVENGSYTIKGVPPGTYTVVFWHETLGEQTQQVTVAAKESKTQDITYKSGTAYAPGSMQIGPALVLP